MRDLSKHCATPCPKGFLLSNFDTISDDVISPGGALCFANSIDDAQQLRRVNQKQLGNVNKHAL